MRYEYRVAHETEPLTTASQNYCPSRPHLLTDCQNSITVSISVGAKPSTLWGSCTGTARPKGTKSEAREG